MLRALSSSRVHAAQAQCYLSMGSSPAAARVHLSLSRPFSVLVLRSPSSSPPSPSPSSSLASLSSSPTPAQRMWFNKHAKRNQKNHDTRMAQQHRDAELRKAGNARSAIKKAAVKAKHAAAVDEVLLECERLGLKDHMFAERQAEVVARENVGEGSN